MHYSYFKHDWFTAEALEDIDTRLQAFRRSDLRAKKTLASHVLALQSDVAHLSLVVRALGDLLIKKGLISDSEIEASVASSDLLDGVADQRLSPKLAKPGSKAPPAPPPKTPTHPRRVPGPRRPVLRRT